MALRKNPSFFKEKANRYNIKLLIDEWLGHFFISFLYDGAKINAISGRGGTTWSLINKYKFIVAGHQY